MGILKDIGLALSSFTLFTISFCLMLEIESSEWAKYMSSKTRNKTLWCLCGGYFCFLCLVIVFKSILRPQNILNLIPKVWVLFLSILWGVFVNGLVSFGFAENTWIELVVTSLLAYSVFLVCEFIDPKHPGTYDILIIPFDVFLGILGFKLVFTVISAEWKALFLLNLGILALLRAKRAAVVPQEVVEADCKKAYDSALEAYKSSFNLRTLFEAVVSLREANEVAVKKSLDVYNSMTIEVVGSTKKKYEKDLHKLFHDTFEEFLNATVESSVLTQQMERRLKEACDSNKNINAIVEIIEDVIRSEYEAACLELRKGYEFPVFLLKSLGGPILYAVKRIGLEKSSLEDEMKLLKMQLEKCEKDKLDAELTKRAREERIKMQWRPALIQKLERQKTDLKNEVSSIEKVVSEVDSQVDSLMARVSSLTN